MMVALDPSTLTYYLNGGPLWYSAKDPLGPWTDIANPPAAVSALVPDSLQRDSAPPGAKPKIVVATSPTELIVTTGDPVWTPITGTDLLYVSNTDASVFKYLTDQKTYVLVSGRWFRATSFDGPWGFVRPDSLPAAFAKIPPALSSGDVLTSVAGTTEAQNAVMDAQIPQTAAVDRSTATLTVTYDGDPRFSSIPGTKVEYAINTSSQVLRIAGLYYACDKAVWFVAPSAKGPWAVSDSVPAAVQTIPPTAPVYNVKYVQVYQSTPTVVYVGYTPGYTYAYPYYGTVVYGTGYVYPAYVSPVVYYPPPVTYGVMVRYNPWTGWTVGFGYSTPFMHVGVVVRPAYGGWYGPYGRPPYPPPYYRHRPTMDTPGIVRRTVTPGTRLPAILATAHRATDRRRATLGSPDRPPAGGLGRRRIRTTFIVSLRTRTAPGRQRCLRMRPTRDPRRRRTTSLVARTGRSTGRTTMAGRPARATSGRAAAVRERVRDRPLRQPGLEAGEEERAAAPRDRARPLPDPRHRCRLK